MEKASDRQRVLLAHLLPSASSSAQSQLEVSACAAGDSSAYQRASSFGDDVVVVAAYRTPICKAKRGGFKDTYPEDLLTVVLKAVLDKTRINPADVGDIVVGTVLGPGSQRARAIECRTAALFAGFPETALPFSDCTMSSGLYCSLEQAKPDTDMTKDPSNQEPDHPSLVGRNLAAQHSITSRENTCYGPRFHQPLHHLLTESSSG